MPDTSSLSEREWNNLLDFIKEKECTPFIGAGAASAVVPIGGTLSREWADENHYPLKDKENLPRVTQFLAIDLEDPTYPKRAVRRRIERSGSPAFDQHNEPHMVLADLELPVYITTNYDSFMTDALALSLERRHPGTTTHRPRREICRWYEDPRAAARRRREREPEPTADHPLVFHLHGHHESPESLVLTEDDYLDFLIRLSEPESLLPGAITKALSRTALLFVGYSLADWTFRVLFRSLSSAVPSGFRFPCIAVQLPPEDAEKDREHKAQEYLKKYFGQVAAKGVNVMVHFQDVNDFAAELRERWEGQHDGR
jgi:hypothetical protein